jgi:hypothetical protein
MKLSELTHMAKRAAFDYADGNLDASPELRAYWLEHQDEIADVFGTSPAGLRKALDETIDAELPKKIHATCRAFEAKARAAKKDAKPQEATRIASDLAARAMRGERVIGLDGVRLAELAALREADHACFVDGDRKTLVPLAPVRALAKVHHPVNWRVSLDGDRLKVSWGTRGYWRAGKAALASEERSATCVHLAPVAGVKAA